MAVELVCSREGGHSGKKFGCTLHTKAETRWLEYVPEKGAICFIGKSSVSSQGYTAFGLDQNKALINSHWTHSHCVWSGSKKALINSHWSHSHSHWHCKNESKSNGKGGLDRCGWAKEMSTFHVFMLPLFAKCSVIMSCLLCATIRGSTVSVLS